MVEFLPVTICVAESAAAACITENVLARNVGTVQDSALPRTVLRRNSRRVLRVMSLFIKRGGGVVEQWSDEIGMFAHHSRTPLLQLLSRQLIFRVAHYEPNS